MVLIRPLNPTAVSEGSALPLLFEVAFHVTTNTDLQSAHPTHTPTQHLRLHVLYTNLMQWKCVEIQYTHYAAGRIIFHH